MKRREFIIHGAATVGAVGLCANQAMGESPAAAVVARLDRVNAPPSDDFVPIQYAIASSRAKYEAIDDGQKWSDWTEVEGQAIFWREGRR